MTDNQAEVRSLRRASSGNGGGMDQQTFCRFRDFVTVHLGIKMPDVKKTMLQSRLQKRLRLLGMSSYEDYCDYVLDGPGREKELCHMIDAVTTNKTDFFREPKHFQYLVETALPEMIRSRLSPSLFRFWSAGCSTGAEPYTLAMVLDAFAAHMPRFRFSILATDISSRVLEEAVAGIYDAEMVRPVPMDLRKKYLLRSKDRSRPVVRIVPELRKKVRFARLNFMADVFGLEHDVQTIFCRNVLIYFDRPTQEKVINRLCRHLVPGGYLFVGHSETLQGLQVPLVQAHPTVYRKTGGP